MENKSLTPDGVPIKSPEDIKNRRHVPIEIIDDGKSLAVLDSVIPVAKERGANTPQKEQHKGFTLCKSSLQILEKIASAVELRDPCLLEGDTGTAKTSSIFYLASLTGHQVMRINLSGHTDTSELIGKFIPNDGGSAIAFEEFMSKPEILKPEARLILEKAKSEGRSLTILESSKIAKIEDLDVPEWRWQDGKLPIAMKKGHWIILDEVNLAEPDIIERLNPVLEKFPSLTITEHNGVKISEMGGDEKLHPDFRIFGTMNPAEFAGRNPMSAAGKDRWTSYLYVKNATAEDYNAMMMQSVYGIQPDVEIHGVKYQQERGEPTHPELMNIDGFEKFIGVFAEFQSKIEEMAREKIIGRNKKEQYVFTRRSMFEFLEFLSVKKILDRETGKKVDVFKNAKEIVLRGIQYYYIDRISNETDQKKVRDMLGSLGLTESTWAFELISKEEKARLEEEKRLKEEKEEQERIERERKEEEERVERERKEAEERERKLKDGIIREYKEVDGSTIVSDGRLEYRGLKVGTLLKAKKGANLLSVVKNAEKLELVGFKEDDDYIIRINDDLVVTGRSYTIEGLERYDIIKAAEVKSEKKKFMNLVSGEIESDGRKMLDIYKVGQKLKLKEGASVREEVLKSKSLEIVGFKDDDKIIMVIDSGRVCVTELKMFERLFTVIPEPEPEKVVAAEKVTEAKLEKIPLRENLRVEIISGSLEKTTGYIIEIQSDGKVKVSCDDGFNRTIARDNLKAEDLMENPEKRRCFPLNESGEAQTDGSVSLDIYKVGQNLKLKEGVTVLPEIHRSVNLKIVGFKGNQIFTMLDSGLVVRDTLKNHGEIYDIIPESTESAETTETTESVEGSEGVDAEALLNRLFSDTGPIRAARREGWSWNISKNEKVVDMRFGTEGRLLEVSEHVTMPDWDDEFFSENELGIDKLINKLKNKKVVSCDMGGRWFLRIL